MKTNTTKDPKVYDSSINKFSSAVTWNLFLYVTYKISSLALTYILYNSLEPLFFSTWASTNALLFIILLWLDFGFKKSIPRFAPIFSKNANLHSTFIITILATQFLLSTLGLVPFFYALSYCTIVKNIPLTLGYNLPTLLAMLFVTESFKNLFQTLYHAHFKQKQFNLFSFTVNTLETFFLLFFTSYTNVPSSTLIMYIFLTKTLSNCLIIAASCSNISSMLTDTTYLQHTQTLDPHDLNKNTPVLNHSQVWTAFFLHSLFIWATTAIKTLTERNILFLYSTHYFGIPIANTFKIFYDSALSFQRIIIKSLGSADTSLLAHIHLTTSSTQDNMHHAVKKIALTIGKLLTLALALAGATYVYHHANIRYTHEMLTLFTIVSIGYIIEILLSPYERMLEVQRNYKLLWLAYSPYILLIAGTAINVHLHPNSISLILLISIIQTSRIISAIIMWQICIQKR